MKYHDFFSGLFFAAVSAGTCVYAGRLGLGSIHNPGSGLIPFGMACLLGLMSIGLIVRSLAGSKEEAPSGEASIPGAWKKVVLTLCGLLGYGLAFNFLGFRLCTFLLMVLLLGVVGRKKWWVTLTVSVFTVIFSYLLFVTWLGCPFPTGPLGI